MAASPIGNRSFAVQRGKNVESQKIVLYGPGGVGKSKLASLVEKIGLKPLFIDLEQGTKFLDVSRIDGITQWEELRAVLHDESIWADFDTVVIDTLTRAEDMAMQWMCDNIKTDKNTMAKRPSDYGFGKQYEHLFDVMLQLLGDMDQHARKGRNVICIAHDIATETPNPGGENWLQYQPRLSVPKSGKNSVRHKVKEWCDHQFFIGYDISVSEDGKGKGGGTRTIYTTEYPSHMAKSRNLSGEFPYEDGSFEIWTQLFKGDSNGND